MCGINLNPILAVRTEPKEQAEMCTQLLFGECFSILKTEENWYYIRNNSDGYEGWIDRKMATIIDENEFKFFTTNKAAPIFKPVVECFINNKESIFLPAGSLIYLQENEEQNMNFRGNSYSIPSDRSTKRNEQFVSGNLIASVAKSFLNAPYLWGGKSIFGIDCSGLVQVCFSICGINLPRDAYQQVQEGEVVNFLQEAKTGDLAFFRNDKNRIIHVGILLDNSTIIHSSGKVRIDKIDNVGIKLSENGNYTHKLKIIKSLFR